MVMHVWVLDKTWYNSAAAAGGLESAMFLSWDCISDSCLLQDKSVREYYRTKNSGSLGCISVQIFFFYFGLTLGYTAEKKLPVTLSAAFTCTSQQANSHPSNTTHNLQTGIMHVTCDELNEVIELALSTWKSKTSLLFHKKKVASNTCMTAPKCTKATLKAKYPAKFVFTDTKHADAAICSKLG
jgi:hypothetical protein